MAVAREIAAPKPVAPSFEHVNPNLSSLGESATLAIHERSAALAASLLRAAGVRVQEPAGGFYLFPDFTPFAHALSERDIQDSPTLCERLLADTGVATLPGEPFGRPRDELTARLSFVDFDGARALAESEAVPPDLELDDAFLDRCCGDVVRAMELIVEWLGAHSLARIIDRGLEDSRAGRAVSNTEAKRRIQSSSA